MFFNLSNDMIMHAFFHHFHHAFLHRHPRHLSRHGHRGFAGFGGRPGFFAGAPGAGLDGFGRGRKLGSADLQLLLLALLAERSSHGYELIKAVEERSKGYYAPSPGMVYPALTYLEEIGHASVEAQGAKKLYSLTEAGRTHLASHRAEADALLEQLAYIGQRMDDVRQAMSGTTGQDEAAPDAAAGRTRGRGRGCRDETPTEIRAARDRLRAALAGTSVEEPEAARRVAEILQRAAEEIRKLGEKP